VWPGSPRLAEATFCGTYPVAELHVADDQLPLEVRLEAYTPFAPFDHRLSGMPMAIFIWRLANRRAEPVAATLTYSQLNPIGYDGIDLLRRGRRNPAFGGNLNEWTVDDAVCGLRMSRPGFDDYHPGSGAGKSTCANLLLRFWDVDRGAITIGGEDLTAFPSSEAAQACGRDPAGRLPLLRSRGR